jgi:hypothetical protein
VTSVQLPSSTNGGARPIVVVRQPLPPARKTDVMTRLLSRLARLWPLSIPALLALHIFGAAEVQPLALRIGTAIPGVLFLLEARRVTAAQGTRQLPFVLVALVQYYVFLCAPVFTDRPFRDLGGDVKLSDEARVAAGYAIGLGALTLVAARIVVTPFSHSVQAMVTRLLPKADLGSGAGKATWLYLAVTMAISVILSRAGNLLPPSLVMPLYVTVSFPLALGLWFALAPRLGPRATRFALTTTVVLGTLNGLVAGFLQPMFRIALAVVGGMWGTSRRAPVTFVIAIVIGYFVLNPVKFLYRQVFWYGQGASAGYVDRVEGMGDAAAEYWTGNDRQEGDIDAALERVSEMNQIIFVFDAVPRRTPFIDGEGWLAILSAPIPRVLWPGKPNNREVTQTYLVKAGVKPQQTKSSFVLPLHVDGYWNFGWVGIIVACLMMGAYLSLAELVFTPRHWALTAMGVAHFAEISAYVNVGRIYMSLFQLLVGHLIVIWVVYRASHLSRGRARA